MHILNDEDKARISYAAENSSELAAYWHSRKNILRCLKKVDRKLKINQVGIIAKNAKWLARKSDRSDGASRIDEYHVPNPEGIKNWPNDPWLNVSTYRNNASNKDYERWAMGTNKDRCEEYTKKYMDSNIRMASDN